MIIRLQNIDRCFYTHDCSVYVCADGNVGIEIKGRWYRDFDEVMVKKCLAMELIDIGMAVKIEK